MMWKKLSTVIHKGEKSRGKLYKSLAYEIWCESGAIILGQYLVEIPT
jgi:hypothetical protein